MICDLCETNAGRTDAHSRCCQIRMLAQAPAHLRKATYLSTKPHLVSALKLEVAAEYKRLQALKTAKSADIRNQAMTAIKGMK